MSYLFVQPKHPKMKFFCRFRFPRKTYAKFMTVMAGLLFLIHIKYIDFVEQQFFNQHYLSFHPHAVGLAKNGCSLPKLDPWDPQAKEFYRKLPPIECTHVQPFLTEVTSAGILQWNQTDIRNFKIQTDKLACTYQEFDRYQGDEILLFRERKTFHGSSQLEGRFVNISCLLNGKLYYYNVHSWIPPELLKISSSSPARPNLLILLLDGMSQTNMIRQLPKTYRVITKKLRSVIFKGHMKVGANTIANLVPILTGHYHYEESLPKRLENGHFDSWPFIWKNFSTAGYITMLLEDRPDITGFNYADKGFLDAPTDIYNRPFWLALEDQNGPLAGKSSNLCFADIAKHTLYLKDLKQTIDIFGKRPFFVLATHTDLSHYYLNLAQLMDDDLVDFLHWFRKTKAKNTILVVMGDHGNNFGAYRQTQLGRIEASMPFFSIYIPKSLRRPFPHLVRNLRRNSNRLTAWFDFHDTLMDIVTLRFNSKKHRWSKYGSSLWYPVSEDRTCQQAGIPIEYCFCETEISIPYSSQSPDDVRAAVDGVLYHVNEMLKVVPQCLPLQMDSVLSVAKRLPNPFSVTAKGFQNVYRIVITTLPNKAVLEATMKADAWTPQFKPSGIIYRVNEYGNSSWCVNDRILKLYCACVDDYKYSFWQTN